jgi:hypothetical protein
MISYLASTAPHARGWCVVVRVLFAVLLLVGAPTLVDSQGLADRPNAIVAASNAYSSIQKQLQLGATWRKQLRDNPKAACSSNKASLCAPNPDLDGNTDPELTVFWATVPPVFDQRNSKHTGGFNAVSRPLDQGWCHTCAAFAVASAAETAIALTLRRNATHMLSVQVGLQLSAVGTALPEAAVQPGVHMCVKKRSLCYLSVTLRHSLL